MPLVMRTGCITKISIASTYFYRCKSQVKYSVKRLKLSFYIRYYLWSIVAILVFYVYYGNISVTEDINSLTDT